MLGTRKTASPAIDGAVAQGVSYELTLAERARRSEKRAWAVAWCAIAMSLLLAGGYFLFLPLKERVPYLVMADPYTGTASVARLTGDFHDRDVTTEEAINKSNVAQFILARESYDSGLIGQRNWRTTLSMAAAGVAPSYMSLHSDQNPERPARLYGATRSLRIRILSIVLIGGGEGRRPTGATVRFQRSIFDKSNGRAQPLDNKIATLEFTYNADLRLSDEDRLLNPLGFRVTNYRVDNDFGAGPVPERDVPAASSTASPGAGTLPAQDMLFDPGANAGGMATEGAVPWSGDAPPTAQSPPASSNGVTER